MSLRNSLYTTEGDGIIRFNASHPIFGGHFPGHPIVPGACLIQIAEELLTEQTGRSTRFTAIRNLKFRQPVTPDMQVVVTIHDGKIEVTDPSLTEIYAQFAATYMCPDTDVQ